MRTDAGDGLMPLYDRALRDRDRARDIAVALEGQVAAVRALMDEWAAHTNDEELPWAHRVRWTVILAKLRAALDPDPGVTSVEDGCTCGGMATCQQCQERDALAAESITELPARDFGSGLP